MNSFGIVGVAFILAVALQQANGFGDLDDHPKMKETRAKCRQEVPVSDEIFNMAVAKKLDEVASDRDLQCYVKCVFSTAKAMNDKGEIDLTNFINGMTPEAKDFYGPSMLNCQKDIDDPDHCMKAFKMYQCFQKNHGEKYYFV